MENTEQTVMSRGQWLTERIEYLVTKRADYIRRQGRIDELIAEAKAELAALDTPAEQIAEAVKADPSMWARFSQIFRAGKS